MSWSYQGNSVYHLAKTGWKFATNHQKFMVVYFFLFMLAEASCLAVPCIIGNMLNCLQTDITVLHASPMRIWRNLSQYLALYFVNEIAFWFCHGPGRLIERFVAFHIKANYKTHLVQTVTKLPLQWHREHHSGENIDKINRASNSLFNFFDTSFESSCMVFRLLGSQMILTCFMPLAGLASFLSAIISFALINRFDSILYKQYISLNRYENKVASAVQDYITNIGSVIALRLEGRVLQEVRQRIYASVLLFNSNCRLNELKWFLVNVVVAIMIVGVLCSYSYCQLFSGKMIMSGTFFMLFQYLRRIGESFYEFARLYGRIVQEAADVESAKVLTESASGQTNNLTHTLHPDWKSLQISGLHFQYSDELQPRHHLVDAGINLTKGKSIALVGESGSGKSTLLSLLRGVQTCENVRVVCDGQLLPGKLVHLAAHTTLIPQHPDIFADSIAFNITFGMEADENAVLQAVELSCFKPVLQRLANGLQTNIAEKGVNLSGGEKQRLALARGIFFAKDSDIILLDEPTSSVDIINERLIYSNLLREFADKCVVSSIHKLHLLELFDEIYVYRQGRLVEHGTLNTLLESDGELCKMMLSYKQGNSLVTA